MQANDKLKQIGHYERELRVAVELSREAGAAILEYYEGPLDIEQKFSADDLEPVTQADKVANQLIVERLAREFPEDGILAEESIDTEHRLDKARVWMVDPLDGTNGFIDGNGDFAVIDAQRYAFPHLDRNDLRIRRAEVFFVDGKHGRYLHS